MQRLRRFETGNHELPALAKAAVTLTTAVVVVAVAGGIIAAVFGGRLTNLGDGFGGLWGVPALALTFIALILGTGAAIKIARNLPATAGRLRIGLLVVVGLWVVAVAYTEVAHLVDPCVIGWWDGESRIGSQPLCERFDSELNWHTRFHLLAHAAPAAVLLAAYGWAIRRWAI